MQEKINKLLSIALGVMLLVPNTVLGAASSDASQKDIMRLITSSQQKNDEGGVNEISLSIISAIFAKQELSNFYELVKTGESDAVAHFTKEYYKWYNMMPEDARAGEMAFKNAKEILIKECRQKLDALWPRRESLKTIERQERVVLESKLFALENMKFDRNTGPHIVIKFKDRQIISNLAADIMGRDYVESTATKIAKAIDLSGSHGYMGYSIENARETVVSILNDIVKYKNRAVNAPNLLKNLISTGAADNSIKVLDNAISTPDGKQALLYFLRTLEDRLGKGGTFCAVGGAVIGVGLLFTASAQASAHNISNSRLAVARELKTTFLETPDLLSTKVIALRSVYGAALVSSVLQENQANMLPLLKAQFAAMQKPQVQAMAKSFLGEASPLTSHQEAEFKKRLIITAAKDNTAVRNINERMKPLQIK